MYGEEYFRAIIRNNARAKMSEWIVVVRCDLYVRSEASGAATFSR